MRDSLRYMVRGAAVGALLGAVVGLLAGRARKGGQGADAALTKGFDPSKLLKVGMATLGVIRQMLEL